MKPDRAFLFKIMLSFTNIQHGLRKKNGLSCNEYVLCDIIFKSSTSRFSLGWSSMTREDIAEELGVSKSGVLKMIERMIKKGFLEREDLKKYLRTSYLWQDFI